MRLEGKVIVVTGSSTGIGKAIAGRCLDEGASVLIHGLEADLAESTWRELDPEQSRSEIIVSDLTKEGAIDQIREVVLGRFGRVDGLVNNAARVGTGNIATTSHELFDEFIAVNVRAPFFLIQALLEPLAEARGAIVNIGSVNAYSGEPDLLPYSISKGALMTMSRNLGDTLHREYGVRVNQINPGWILTENEKSRKEEQGLPEDWPSQIGDQFAPAGRLFDPDEIAAAVVYFLSKEAGPVSGSVLDIEQHPMIGRNPSKTIDS